MTIPVIALACGLNESRAAAWAWCRARLESLDLNLRVVEHTEGQWHKPTVVNAAVRALDAEHFGVIDADCAFDPSHLTRAIAVVEGGAPWAVAHREVRRLSRERTAELLREEPTAAIQATRQDLGRAPYQVEPGGGFFVCTRATWEATGGFDPRFVGWGCEDVAWGWSAQTLCGPPAVTGSTCWHLWHASELRGDIGANLALQARYKRAGTSPKLMRQLVAERTIPAGS